MFSFKEYNSHHVDASEDWVIDFWWYFNEFSKDKLITYLMYNG